VKYVWTAIRMTIVTAVIAGIIYPLAMTGLAQVIFPGKADGSLIKKNGVVIGSSLIGQNFTAAKYFLPRPSAAGSGYDAMDSSFSNLGPTNKNLADRVQASVKADIAANPGLKFGEVPIDMVTTSGSGLDPDITIANARAQAARVAAARGLSVSAVLALIAKHTAGRQLGVLGEPTVNVLQLNLALDAGQGAASP
jgi:potassium-transporting ATPase KdpC subunit